jgi:hypothetical protein
MTGQSLPAGVEAGDRQRDTGSSQIRSASVHVGGSSGHVPGFVQPHQRVGEAVHRQALGPGRCRPRGGRVSPSSRIRPDAFPDLTRLATELDPKITVTDPAYQAR